MGMDACQLDTYVFCKYFSREGGFDSVAAS